LGVTKERQIVQKTIRQHTVPQCYLRRFCREGERLFAFDKTTRKSFPTNVADIAVQRYFYDLPEDHLKKACPGQNIDVQIVEKSFMQMEGRSKALFDELLDAANRHGVIPRLLRLHLAPYIIFQWLRTRLARDHRLELMIKTREALVNAYLEKKNPEAAKIVEIKVEFDRTLLPLVQAQTFFNEARVAELAAIIDRHIWFIGLNKTIQPYYTSDHPVVKKANREHPGRSFTGLRSPGIEIAFPLSSKHLLVMLERSHFQKVEELDGRAVPMNAFGVEHFNALQVMKCHRQVYCEAEQFEQAEGVCRRYPEACSPERSTVEVSKSGGLLRILTLD
jgi:uncharacterized protein DUF4238